MCRSHHYSLCSTEHSKIKAPQISSFRLPAKSAFTIVLYAWLLYLTYPDISPSSLFTPARTIGLWVGGFSTLKRIWQGIFAVHFLESLYTLSLCKKHQTGFAVGVSLFDYACLCRTSTTFWQGLYVLSTIIFGFPIWVDLRKRIQEARIESVMKVE